MCEVKCCSSIEHYISLPYTRVCDDSSRLGWDIITGWADPEVTKNHGAFIIRIK